MPPSVDGHWSTETLPTDLVRFAGGHPAGAPRRTSGETLGSVRPVTRKVLGAREAGDPVVLWSPAPGAPGWEFAVAGVLPRELPTVSLRGRADAKGAQWVGPGSRPSRRHPHRAAAATGRMGGCDGADGHEERRHGLSWQVGMARRLSELAARGHALVRGPCHAPRWNEHPASTGARGAGVRSRPRNFGSATALQPFPLLAPKAFPKAVMSILSAI